MIELTFEDIFHEQLERGAPLTEESDQIQEGRKDFFGDEFVVGDTQLFVVLVEGKTSHIEDTTVEITSITPRSWDQLLQDYVYEPQWDSRNHVPHMKGTMPRFVKKPQKE